ncbi:hypothetical protein HMPREF1419_01499 [Helicobacter pylori GAM263BFi]|nr:hypothetical protein HMPREF1419_01499 [Helicobacter pylori GAM263BFi]
MALSLLSWLVGRKRLTPLKNPLISLSKNKCFKSSTLTMYKPFFMR